MSQSSTHLQGLPHLQAYPRPSPRAHSTEPTEDNIPKGTRDFPSQPASPHILSSSGNGATHHSPAQAQNLGTGADPSPLTPTGLHFRAQLMRPPSLPRTIPATSSHPDHTMHTTSMHSYPCVLTLIH